MKTSTHAMFHNQSPRIIVISFILTLSLLAFSGMGNPLDAQDQIPSYSGVNIYAEFDEIRGSSMDTTHLGWSEALAVGFEIGNNMSDNRGFAISSLEGLNIVKPISIDSPLLALVCTKGTFLSKVTIHFVAYVLESPMILYEIILHHARIQSVSSGSQFAEDSLKEAIRLQGERIEWIAYEYDPDGTLKGKIMSCWDFARRRECVN